MHTSSPMDSQEAFRTPTPSAPPYPPPPSSLHMEQPKNQSNPLDTKKTTKKPHNSPLPWASGLCNCCSDISTCCLTCWCPCVTFGRIAEIVDRGSTSCGVSGTLYALIMCFTGCSCLYSCFYRTKLRGQYFLKESPCTDCCTHCCCEGCALCQEYRELKNQGYNMSIGWHGNLERQKRAEAAKVPPVPESNMIR